MVLLSGPLAAGCRRVSSFLILVLDGIDDALPDWLVLNFVMRDSGRLGLPGTIEALLHGFGHELVTSRGL
jgi:hypothetical protein